MAVPPFQDLMLTVLKAASEGETTISRCAERAAKEFRLSKEDVAALLPSGRSGLLYNRVAWAKTHLVAARLLEATGRGIFRATDRGRALLQEAPARVDMRLLARYPEYVEFRRRRTPREKGPEGAGGGTDGDGGTTETATSPWERIDEAAGEIHRALRAEILEAVYRAGQGRLEDLARDLLRALGYGGPREESARRVGGSHDGGVDVVVDEDALGLGTVCLQAKCYALDRAIEVSEVRDFAGALDGRRTKKGVFVTTSRFTDPALRYVEKLGEKKIVLIDGERLADLMIEHGLGVQAARTVVLKRIDGEFFEGGGAGGA